MKNHRQVKAYRGVKLGDWYACGFLRTPKLTARWKVEEERHDGAAFVNVFEAYSVISSVHQRSAPPMYQYDPINFRDPRLPNEQTERRVPMELWWHHLSCSRADHTLPSWELMALVKELFMGKGVEAYMVHPPTSRYVNIYPVLHWWSCLDFPEGVLPQFEGTLVLGGKEVASI